MMPYIYNPVTGKKYPVRRRTSKYGLKSIQPGLWSKRKEG